MNMASVCANRKLISSDLSSKKYISVEINCNQHFDMTKLVSLQPDFVAVTWIGCYDCSIPEEIPPIKLAKELIHTHHQTVLLHLPCRNFKRNTALNILSYIKQIGVRNILALKGQSSFNIEMDDSKVEFPFASFIVEFIKENFGDYFTVGVAGYPEKHPKSANIEEDIKYLKLKVLKGADFILTQACFEYSIYKNFLERCRASSITSPILAGVCIVASYEQIEILRKICKVSVDNDVVEFMLKHRDDNEVLESFGKNMVLDLVEKIVDDKVFSGIHIFTMNNLDICTDVLNSFNKRFI